MDPTDPNTLPLVLDKGIYVAIGMLAVWLLKSGWAAKAWETFRTGRKEVREEAKEAPERELQVVKEQLLEYKTTLKGVIVELNEMREHNKNCEVNQARQEERIKTQDGMIAELRRENTELKNQIQSLQKQAGVWKQVQVDVQAMQEHQDQQGK
jgi:predicted nuclease with TOPRIM domain